MPRFDDQVFGMQLEEIAAATTTPAARSRIYSDITSTSKVIPRFYDGTRWTRFSTTLREKRAVTASGTVTIAETDDLVYISANSGNRTVALPPVGTHPGKIVEIVRTDNDPTVYLEIDGDSGETIDGALTRRLYMQYESVVLMSTGAEWIVLTHKINTDAVTFSPSVNWVANTTATGKYWRRGPFLNMDVHLALAGAPTSATLTLTLPNSWAMDTTNYFPGAATASRTPIQGWVTIDDGGAEVYTGQNIYGSTTTIIAFVDDGDKTISGITQANPITFASTDDVWMHIRDVPIANWW